LRSQFPETALVVAAAGLGFRIALTPAEDQEKLKEQPIQRLMKLAKEQDRSVNYLVGDLDLGVPQARGEEVRPILSAWHLPRSWDCV